MKTTETIVAQRAVRITLDMLAQFNGATVLALGTSGSEYGTIGTTSSLTYVPLFTAQYTVDTNGFIKVLDIRPDMFSNNSANGISKLQISGDGGTTFVDITGDIGTGLDLRFTGPGQWIHTIQAGTNQLQFRILGKSTNGAVATIRVRNDSFIYFVFNKTINLEPINYGFTSGGNTGVNVGTNERFDDAANYWAIRALITARSNLAGYNIDKFGFTTGGSAPGEVGTTERFDDTVNTQTARTAITARCCLAAFSMTTSLGSFGYSVCGRSGANDLGTVQRFDDSLNTQTTRQSATARSFPTGYNISSNGFSSGGDISGTGEVGITEKFDDIGNVWTSRANITSRFGPAGYNLGGLGFVSGGGTAATVLGTTERFDDSANTQTARAEITPRYRLTGYNVGGFGITSCGFDIVDAASGLTEKLDDSVNTQTSRQIATPRVSVGGYSVTF